MSRKNNSRNNRRSNIQKKQRGGNCATSGSANAKNCFDLVDLNRYREPCNYVGGRRRSNSRKQRSSKKQQRGGNCSAPIKSCMTGDQKSIIDGAFSQSECAWAARYTAAPANATNVVGGSRRSRKQRSRKNNSRNRKQRGGQYSLNLVDKIGGLSRVDASYDPYAPSFKNLQVTGPAVSDMKVIDIVPPQNMLGDAMPNETSSQLARNSFQIPQCGAGRRRRSQRRSQRGGRNYLLRRGGNKMRGGGDYPGVYNGVPSDFSADMTTRKFDCYQPNWCPKCT